jgi:hypothetical protein
MREWSVLYNEVYRLLHIARLTIHPSLFSPAMSFTTVRDFHCASEIEGYIPGDAKVDFSLDSYHTTFTTGSRRCSGSSVGST